MKTFLSRFLFLTFLLSITPTSYARVGGGESYDDGGGSDYSDNSSDNSSSSYDNSSYYESNDDSGGSSGPADFKLVFWLFVLPIFLFFVFYQFGRLKEFIDQKREKWMYWKNAKWMKKI
ncbi:MAG: hypothetical protein K1X56_12490, partial [Flavobacteriales bacterium]|nr:hypothetical protein [Flavobacteriales bacterium]